MHTLRTWACAATVAAPPPTLADPHVRADYEYMNRRLAKVVALVAVVLLAFLVVGWFRNLGPDEEKAKREVARVIPEHIEVVSITGGDCGWGLAAPCSIRHTLRADPAEYGA